MYLFEDKTQGVWFIMTILLHKESYVIVNKTGYHNLKVTN